MSTSNDPDAIRADIERTRSQISDDVNALAEGANPKNIAKRQVDRVKEGAQGLKERIFGSNDDDDERYGQYDAYLDPYAEAGDSGQGGLGGVAHGLGDKAHELGDKAQGAVSDATLAVRRAPASMKRRTRGNPLAAGLIAFGIGALVGGLFPASSKEKELVGQAKQKAQPLVDEVGAAVKEAGENLKGSAQDAVESVKATATEAGQNVKAEAQGATQDLSDQAKQSAASVRDASTANQGLGI